MDEADDTDSQNAPRTEDDDSPFALPAKIAFERQIRQRTPQLEYLFRVLNSSQEKPNSYFCFTAAVRPTFALQMPKKHGLVPEQPRPLTTDEKLRINRLISANQQKVRDLSAHFERQRQVALEHEKRLKQVRRSVPPKFESYTSMGFNVILPDRTESTAESAEEKHEKLVAQIRKELRSLPPDHALYLSTVRHLGSAARAE